MLSPPGVNYEKPICLQYEVKALLRLKQIIFKNNLI